MDRIALALIASLAAASPAPSASPLRTIVTVRSTPYCNALAKHFNGAYVPIYANDRTLDGVSLQLGEIDRLFDHPDYVERYLHARDALGREVDRLNASLGPIQQQIDALRAGAKLTGDARAAAELESAARQLQSAFDEQKRLAIDLQGVHQAMLQYDIMNAHPAMGGFDPRLMAEPEDMRSIKRFLRFEGRRDSVARAEAGAVDTAYSIATKYCSPPSPAPQ